MCLHLVFENWACKGTCGAYVPANEPGHVTTVALALLERVELDVSFGHVIGPRNKPPWAERLMASAALTGRTMFELSLPVVSWDLLECFIQ
jgi:hypothetical protein